MDLAAQRLYAQPILETVNSRLEAFIHGLSIVCPSFIPAHLEAMRCSDGHDAQFLSDNSRTYPRG